MSSPAERGGAHGAGEVTGTDRLGEDAARAYLDAVERQRSALRRRPVAAAAKRTSTDARLACACCPSCSRPSGQTTSSRSRTSTHTQGARAAKRSVFVARRGSRERAEQQSHYRVCLFLIWRVHNVPIRYGMVGRPVPLASFFRFRTRPFLHYITCTLHYLLLGVDGIPVVGIRSNQDP